MVVPFGTTAGSCEITLLPSMVRCVPISESSVLVFSSTCAMAAIDAKASPRKPLVCKLKRSSADLIFEVAWRSKLSLASVTLIPIPLSVTCTRVFPASLITSVIEVAFASMAFSNNSFTTEAGRCTTSPAAIWFAT